MKVQLDFFCVLTLFVPCILTKLFIHNANEYKFDT
jgi:hypothetical protein